MHPPGIDSSEPGLPPLRRAVVGLLLGLLTGAAAAPLLPRDRRGAAAAPADAFPGPNRPPR